MKLNDLLEKLNSPEVKALWRKMPEREDNTPGFSIPVSDKIATFIQKKLDERRGTGDYLIIGDFRVTSAYTSRPVTTKNGEAWLAPGFLTINKIPETTRVFDIDGIKSWDGSNPNVPEVDDDDLI